MSKFTFRKATKKQARLKMAIYGASGSGKTYTALSVATHLTPGGVALIDTEHGSASKYADRFDFDVVELDDFHPQNYIDAIKAASEAGYKTLVIDSLSHAWSGPGGALELVDKAAAAQRSKNTYTAWKNVTPLQNQLIHSIISTPVHIIATMRAKTEYVVEQNKGGKAAPRKVGTQPIQRDGMEYEFDLVAYMDQDNNLIVEKTRCSDLQGAVINKPNGSLSVQLAAWLSDGQPVKEESSTPPPKSSKSPAATDEIGVPADDLPRVDRSSTYTHNPKTPPCREKIKAKWQKYPEGTELFAIDRQALGEMWEKCPRDSEKAITIQKCIMWRAERRKAIDRLKACSKSLANWAEKEDKEKVIEWQGKLWQAAQTVGPWEMSDLAETGAELAQMIYDAIDDHDFGEKTNERMLAIAADLEREATVKGGAK